jgi:glucuronoarabinoxylan endo-1,4-beta-xylanase
MKKYLQNQKPELFLIDLIVITFLFIFPLNAQNQTFVVKGNVSGSNSPIYRASVTLVDKSDTTKQVLTLTDVSGNYSLNVITSVESSESLPSKFALEQNYPNPFSSSTSISYELNKQTDVQLTIYDVLGREVKKFSVGNQNVGVHGVQWDARNNFGVKLASGVYFYTMQVGGKTLTKKMILGTSLENNSIVLPFSSVRTVLSQKIQNEFLGNRTYQIRIDNYYSRTSPAIVPKIIDNILITKDTTININVDKAALYATSNIYLDSIQQIVRGFGASNVLLWRPDMTESEINTAFGTGDGQVGFSILRIMAEADSTRWPLYLPSTQKAQALGATIIASPWQAPSEMLETVGTQIRIRYDMYDKYAAHLNAFNAYMKNNGVSIYGLSVQNEPDVLDNSWTHWSANEMLTFMRGYANAIEGTKVMDPESMSFNRAYSDPILNDSAACANTDIICGHLYGGGLAAYPLAQQKGKEIWMTEYLSGENYSGNDWAWCLPVAQQMNDVLQAGMSAYVWWNIIRFYGPISDGTIDTTKGSGNAGDVTKKGYVMSQFSRFIRPGYHIIQSTSSRGSIRITAAKGDLSKVVIVATNSDTVPIVQTFNLQNSSANSFTPYTTTSTKNCELGNIISVQNGSFTVTLEPSSIITFVSN